MRYVKYVRWESEETMSRFRSLWDEGVSTRVIGEQLGCSKNSVVGKAHREHRANPSTFAPRPSPIPESTGRPRVKVIRRESKALLPQLGAPVIEPTVAIKPAPLKVEPCVYPTETGGWPKLKYCDIPSMPGKPYCAAHCLSCYIAINSKDGKRIREGWKLYEEKTNARARAGILL
jgi:GcrA cell cycle regulator